MLQGRADRLGVIGRVAKHGGINIGAYANDQRDARVGAGRRDDGQDDDCREHEEATDRD
jgi:hypothetical protein